MRLHLRKQKTPAVSFTPDYRARLAREFNLQAPSDANSSLRSIHEDEEALAWRIALIERAEHSIDAQYYSWHLDTSGLVLIDRLIDAADRGVRVRILLDDIHTFGIDRHIAVLNSHANIEVRLFNPFTYRSSYKPVRLLELLFNLGRLNHRMHNKLLVVDNLVAILGGRNVGDEYFGLHDSFVFRDLDLVIAGSCIEDLSDSFDVYWNHHLSFTARKLIRLRPRRLEFRHLRARITRRLRPHRQVVEAIVNRTRDIFAQAESAPVTPLLPIRAGVEVFYDAPSLETSSGRQTVDALYDCMAQTREQIVILSAYFIPDQGLLDSIRKLRQDNISVRLYTNSLASIDVTAAFSGYQRYRQQLLDLGVELFEYRAWRDEFTRDETRRALHAKSIIYDNSRVYVGTLNLDPRSARLNTEIGLLVDSPELALDIAHAIGKQQVSGHYWHIEANSPSRLSWHFASTRLSRQPDRGRWQRISNWLFSLLPIQRHL